jgi:hypothetical protein
MISRRNVLTVAAAGVAGTLTPISAWSAGSHRIGSARGLCRAVFNERYDECLAFARELDHRGAVTTGIRNDVAALWYKDLRPQLRQTPLPLAGLTDPTTLFCLEELARDVDMKVLYRIDRTVEPGGRVRHDVTGPAAVVEAARNLGAAKDFGRAMAVLASDVEARGPWNVASLRRTGPSSAPNGTALVSWVIA